MHEAIRKEAGDFGFIPIVLVAVIVAVTVAALTIGWIWAWVHLREENKGVIVGSNLPAHLELYSPPAKLLRR